MRKVHSHFPATRQLRMTATTNRKRIERQGLRVAPDLLSFIEDEALPESGVTPLDFWSGLSHLLHEHGARNRELLEKRASLQSQIDEWHRRRRPSLDRSEYKTFLEEIGYLVSDRGECTIDTVGVDPEIATIAGPQLVVPVSNARYALNAANARWGSLYDAVYGTDALGDSPPRGGYDAARGARVVAWGRSFLDETFPLIGASHADAVAYRVADGDLVADTGQATTPLADRAAFIGYDGEPEAPSRVLLRHHGLAVDIAIDRDNPIGSTDPAGISDIILESAVTVIMDCEDSVAAVDGADKAGVYRNWLGVVKGDLAHNMRKNGKTFTRRLHPARTYTSPTGGSVVLPAQALMLVRNVGLLMTTPAVLDTEGNEVFEGLLDDMVNALCATHRRADETRPPNSRHDSIYVVKPKLHGPEEVAFVDGVFAHVEKVLGLNEHTIKLGLMDEERRTTLNLKECIRAARSRIAFINTGFLDRTGDEIHTSMEAGPVIRKADMKQAAWIKSYEDWNVDVGVACGLPGRAQIGKGMWAAPDLMEAMLEEKIAHPEAGASTAWVPSPTAATLHAVHYHRVDVGKRQRDLNGKTRASLDDLLLIPLAPSTDWPDDEKWAEVENNAQGILGYVVRWIDHGVGCSKVPDIHDVALMEDRATCRISSQHIANWLNHGIVTREEVLATMKRMAAVVDRQNADDPTYVAMGPAFIGNAFRAAAELVFEGTEQPSGYTEPILHKWRLMLKSNMSEEES